MCAQDFSEYDVFLCASITSVRSPSPDEGAVSLFNEAGEV